MNALELGFRLTVAQLHCRTRMVILIPFLNIDGESYAAKVGKTLVAGKPELLPDWMEIRLRKC